MSATGAAISRAPDEVSERSEDAEVTDTPNIAAAPGAAGTTLPRAAWRHRWFVLAMAAGGAAAGLLVSATQSPGYQATASLVVSNSPAAVAETEGGAIIDTNPERYVADQVAILELPAVSDLAAESANTELAAMDDPSLPTDLTGDDVRVAGEVSNVTGTNLIEITVTAAEPEVARVVADALASAYQSVRSSQNQTASSIDALEAALGANQENLTEVEGQITELRIQEGGTSLNDQYRRLLQQIGTSGSDDIDATVAAITSLQQIERQLPAFAPLYARRDGLLQEGASIQAQIDAVNGDGQKAASNIAVFSPAQEPVPAEGLGGATLMALGAIFLGGVAVAISYWRDARRRVFTDAMEPAAILEAPLIAEIPHFHSERLPGLLPVIEAPESVAAEAFRFAVQSLRASAGDGVYGFVSPTVGDGKTVTTANFALAHAQLHTPVLAVDADLKAQGLVQLFPAPDGAEDVPGITEVIASRRSTYELIRLDLGDDGHLDLLPGGVDDRDRSNQFGSSASAALFARFREEYGLTVLDVAPLLNVAYATAVLKDADGAVVVIRHGSPITNAEQLAARLHLFEVPVVGYIYAMAPIPVSRRMESVAPVPLRQNRLRSSLTRKAGRDAERPTVSIVK